MSCGAGPGGRRPLIVVVTIAVLIAACSAESGGTAATTSEATTTATGATTTSATSTTTTTTATTATTIGGDGGNQEDEAENEAQGSPTTTRTGDRTCIVHDGLERCWFIHVPAAPSAPAPLVLDFHGWTSNAGSQRASSGFEALAEEDGFVVVWPEGYRSSFNAGRRCCPPANQDLIDDVDFVRQIVSVVSDVIEIDLDRVYLTGLSNGCAMAQRVAADASDLVAAVACMSLYLLDEADPGYSSVPVMELHGTDDGVVAYQPSAFFGGAEANWSAWAELNGCTGEAAETWRSGASVARTYQSCDGDSEVSLVTIDRGGHALYAGLGTDIDTTGLAWDFMRRFDSGG